MSALLCIMGPTASGKTALAIALAEALDGELVSVDSALVYRGMNIGSAKPAYPHHLIDICDPADAYSAARFAADARVAIDEIRGRGRRPILVGGTMLYYRALLEGLAPLPASDPALRAAIEADAQRFGWPQVHRQLARVDPDSAARIHPHHSQRLTRALEVYRLTGEPMSRLHRRGSGGGLTEPVAAVAVAPRERSVLHARIAQRLDEMLESGFVEEVRGLRSRGDLHRDLPAMRAVGYRQLWAYLEGERSLEEAKADALAATRQLAKRQLTWLRKWPALNWLHTDASEAVVAHDLGPATTSSSPADVLLNYLRRDPM